MDAVEFLNKTLKKHKIDTASQYTKFQDVAIDFHNKVVLDKFEVDLFAAALYSAVQAGTADRSLYDQFVEATGANACTFIGD